MFTLFPFSTYRGTRVTDSVLVLEVTVYFRTDSPWGNHCSPGTLPRFGLEGSRFNICYDHQDLHRVKFHSLLPSHFITLLASFLLFACVIFTVEDPV